MLITNGLWVVKFLCDVKVNVILNGFSIENWVVKISSLS